MDNSFDSVIAAASEKILADIYNNYESDVDSRVFVALSKEQVSDLGHRILSLPDDDIAMLLLRYAFALDYGDISVLLKQSSVKGKIKYAEHLLSAGMGFDENEGIDGESLRASCNIALEKYTKDEGSEHTPRYSRQFKKKMRKMKLYSPRPSTLVKTFQRAAVALLVIVLSLCVAMVAHAGFRNKVFHWLVETFPKFSEFALSSGTDAAEKSFDDLKQYRPSFIPDGFIEKSVFEMHPSIYWYYYNENDEFITITGSLPDEAVIALNTEGADVAEMIFLDAEAFYWEKDGLSYFVFSLDGYHFDIFGQIDRDNIVHIANNIKK